MGNLLRADFFRLWRSKSFWFCMLVQVGLGGFAPVLCFMDQHRTPFPGPHPLDPELFNYIPFVCILAALFCALFIGTEYSDGTVRNQLVVGHRRRNIYLCHLITCTTATLLMCVGYILPYLAVGTPLFGFLQEDASTILAYVGTSLVLTVALTSLYTMLAMLIPNRAVSAVVALVLSFVLLISGSYLYSYLNYPPTYTQLTYDPVTGAMVEEVTKYPFYLEGTKRQVYQLLCDVSPGGQVMQCTTWDAPNLPRLPVYSAAFTVVTTGVGLWLYRRKDLR